MSSDTPRTDSVAQGERDDAAEDGEGSVDWVDADFARQLERDLAAAVKERDMWQHQAETAERVDGAAIAMLREERDALRDTVAEWEQDVGDAMAGACYGAGDEAHCACVPALKIGMTRLRKERESLRDELRAAKESVITNASRWKSEIDALRELLLQTRDYINHTHQGCAHYKSLHDRCDCGCDDLDERIRAVLERKP